jgi:hypothetical protein
MMKPDWKDAPKWANYLTMDESGEWCWFENEPIEGLAFWHDDGGNFSRVDMGDWQKTLEQRPTDKRIDDE